MRPSGGFTVAALLLVPVCACLTGCGAADAPATSNQPTPIKPTTGVIKGHVTIANSGLPLAAATITTTPATASATTDLQGSFSLGAVPPGAYVVTARLSGYRDTTASASVAAGDTATVSLALGIVPVATSLVKVAGDSQTALVGAFVSVAPAVMVKDQSGNAIANQSVTFSIGLGGGAVVGGTATTASTGIAAVSKWQLGSTPGTNTLVASAAGLPSVTFTATATSPPPDPCASVRALPVGTSTTGTLGTGSCAFLGHADLYSVTVPASQLIQLDMTPGSPTMAPVLTVTLAAASIDSSQNWIATDMASAGAPLRFRLIVPAGDYHVAASAQQTGQYTLSASTWDGTQSPACDLSVRIAPGVTYGGAIAGNGCAAIRSTGQYVYGNLFRLATTAGRSYTIKLTSTVFDPVLVVQFPGGSFTDDGVPMGGTARITFTATTDASVAIFAASAAYAPALYPYFLTITSP